MKMYVSAYPNSGLGDAAPGILDWLLNPIGTATGVKAPQDFWEFAAWDTNLVDRIKTGKATAADLAKINAEGHAQINQACAGNPTLCASAHAQLNKDMTAAVNTYYKQNPTLTDWLTNLFSSGDGDGGGGGGNWFSDNWPWLLLGGSAALVAYQSL